MLAPPLPPEFSAPVTERLRTDVARLRPGQTVGEALESLRRLPPPGRIVYFYVADDEGRLQGVVPVRRLVLSAPDARVAEVMSRDLIALPAKATVLEACELFLRHRLLALPVVDDGGRLLGVADVELYADALKRLDRAAPVARLVAPFVRFLEIESAGGLVLLAFTLAALALANSPWAAGFDAFWQAPVGVSIGNFSLTEPLLLWVNDGLMAVFFFVVGLEIKRELAVGELSEVRKALLPVVAAAGGMVVPALVYLATEWGRPGERGWGVPMATDIAFVVGFLTLLGPRVPAGLKVMLLSLAIADDIGAVLVIAVVYTTDISLAALALAAAGFGVVLLMQRLGVRNVAAYAVVGAGIWLAMFGSGVHPTVAGVLLGLATPARPWAGARAPLDAVGDIFRRFRVILGEEAPGRREAVSPLERLEGALHPWVAFGIMPVFALANAGVRLEPGAVGPVTASVAAGLVLGKPVGIFLFSWAAVRLGLARLPSGVGWKVLLGGGCLGGIGFTMSLFIAHLALAGELLESAKVGILGGSALSAAMGCAVLLTVLRKPAPGPEDVTGREVLP